MDAEAGVVRARATFSSAYEGAPGLLHGGILAAAFDEGRRLFVSAEVNANGACTAEASGVFIAVGGERFEELARARREREEPG